MEVSQNVAPNHPSSQDFPIDYPAIEVPPWWNPFMEIQHGIIHHGTPFHEIDFPSWNPMVEPLHGVTPPYFSRLPGTFSAPMVFSVACARETCALSTRSLHTGGPSQLLIIGGGIYVAGIRSDTVITIVI